MQGWDAATGHTPELVKTAEVTFDCCGSGLEYRNGTLEEYTNPNEADRKWSDDNKVEFKASSACFNHSSVECLTCYKHIEDKVWGDQLNLNYFTTKLPIVD